MDKNKYKNTFCTIDMQLDTIRCNNFLRTWITNSVKNYIKIFESHVLSSLRNVRLCSIKMERRWFEFENGFFYLKKHGISRLFLDTQFVWHKNHLPKLFDYSMFKPVQIDLRKQNDFFCCRLAEMEAPSIFPAILVY